MGKRFVDYDNAEDILTALSTSPGMKYKSINCGGLNLGNAIKNFFLPNASSIAWVDIPVLRIYLPVGGHIYINVANDGYSGPQYFHKVFGTETAADFDGKWVGIDVFNDSDTQIQNMPYIKISGGRYRFNPTTYPAGACSVSIINDPKVEIVIPRANGTVETSGAKIVTDNESYFYGTESSAIVPYFNYKIIDISDILADDTTNYGTAGESWDDGLSSMGTYDPSSGVWTQFTIVGKGTTRRTFLGKAVDQIVRNYMLMLGQNCAYVSRFYSEVGVTSCKQTNFIPTNVRMGAMYVGVCYK